MRVRRLTSTALAAVALGACAATVVKGRQTPLDYPQWRGRDRDGSASGFVVPRVWPQTLTRRWCAEVGEGYSTPIVVGGTVYVFARQGENEVIAALDAATGSRRWRTAYPAPYMPSQPAAAHGAGPKATPLAYDGRLFTLGISGILSAVDAADGALLWQTPPPAEAPFYGAASSPLGEGNLVILHPGNYEPLTAFDALSGQRRWTAGAGGFFSSPVAATLDGVRQVVTATQESIIGVALDGRVLWRQPWAGGEGSTTPVVDDGLVVIGSGRAGTVALRPALREGQWTVDTVWTAPAVTLYTSDPVVLNGAVYGLSTRDKGRFFALDATTGQTLWLGDPREADHTAIVKSGDFLFLLNDDAELVVARASRTAFEPLARYSVAESATWAQPLISGNRVYIKDVSNLTLWTLD
jgi:outer membrane protein assembly factor BamB